MQIFPALLFALGLLGACHSKAPAVLKACGSVLCAQGEQCCSELCSACAAPGESCETACGIDGVHTTEDAGHAGEDASVPSDPCALKQCAVGSECQVQAGEATCVPKVQPGESCGALTCDSGEVCCDATCGACAKAGACADPACPTDPGSCDNVSCVTGRHCELVAESCDAGDCPMVATCVDDVRHCDQVECAPGQVCVEPKGVAQCVPESSATPCLMAPCTDARTYCDDSSGKAVCKAQPTCEGVDCGMGQACQLTPHDNDCDASTQACIDTTSCVACEGFRCAQLACTGAYCKDEDYCTAPDGIAHCVPDSTVCEGFHCDAGYHCLPNDVECLIPPCTPEPVCVPE